MTRAKPAPVATRHGATQPEGERANKQRKLRLTPAADRELARRAERSGLTMSAVVSALLMATAAPDRSNDR